MVEAPEKIWAYHNGNSQTYLTAPNKFHNVEYVRADIAAGQLAEKEAEIARIKLHCSAWEDSARINKAEHDRLAADNARKDTALKLARTALQGEAVGRTWYEQTAEALEAVETALTGKE